MAVVCSVRQLRRSSRYAVKYTKCIAVKPVSYAVKDIKSTKRGHCHGAHAGAYGYPTLWVQVPTQVMPLHASGQHQLPGGNLCLQLIWRSN